LKIKEKNKKLLIDLSGEVGKEIVIKLPGDYSVPKLSASNKDFKIIKTSQVKFGFVEIDAKVGRVNKKIRVPKNINAKKQPELTNKSFNEVSPAEWKPRHLVQYVKYHYKKVYDTDVLPLELDWKDFGRTKNAAIRNSAWAYAKHLMEKFDRLKISRKRMPDYIKFSFEENDLVPSMPLLRCDAWVDKYYKKVVLTRKRNVTQEQTTKKKDSKKWRQSVDNLK